MPVWFVVSLFLFLGFILLLVELFIIPGFGFVGAAGLILMCLGSYVSFKSLSLITGLAVSIGSLVFVIFFIRFFVARASRSLSLQDRQDKERGFTSSRNYDGLLGKKGETLTDLRPSGTASIGGEKVSVVTDGVFVDKGVEIKVVKVEGNKIFVRVIEKQKNV